MSRSGAWQSDGWIRPNPCACPAYGELLWANDLVYTGARYRRCTRCETSAVAVFPTASQRGSYYEREYPLRYDHARVSPLRAGLLASMLDRLENFGQPGHLLDVGCGGGHLLEAANRRGWRSLGTDLSYQACAMVRKGHGLPVIQADSAAVPMRDRCMDAVTFVNVLDHVSDPLGTLREAFRVLTPRGYLVIRIPNAAFHRPWVRLLTRLGPLVRWYGWDGCPVLHLYAFTAGGLRRLVERAGFDIIEIQNSAAVAEQLVFAKARADAAGFRWFRWLISALAAGIKAPSFGRWLLGSSVEVYAQRPLVQPIGNGGRRRAGQAWFARSGYPDRIRRGRERSHAVG